RPEQVRWERPDAERKPNVSVSRSLLKADRDSRSRTGPQSGRRWYVAGRERASRRTPMILRRTVLVALAAAAAHSAFAQTQMPGGDAGPDEQYIRETSAIGSLSLAINRIAQEKAQ